MGLRRSKDGDGSAQERWLEVDASMTGTLTFKDPVNLQINGSFEGTLDTKGKLLIGPKARVQATVRGEEITIDGTLSGNVTATVRMELRSNARMTGKLITPILVVQEGAVFHGTLEMLSGQDARWIGAEELARYLEVDMPTVEQWAKQGRLPAQQHGGTWRFERARIEEWLAQEKIKQS